MSVNIFLDQELISYRYSS